MPMQGRQKHVDRLKMLSGQGRLIKAVGRVLYVGADTIRAHAFREISRGSVSGAGHVPSAPGEYPNRDTGVLQAGLRAELVKPLVAEVSSNAPYANALEFGTSRMAARPYMRPSRDAKAGEVREMLVSEVNKIVKGSAK